MPDQQREISWVEAPERVFVVDWGKEILRQDVERKQDFEVTLRTYDALLAVYIKYGYELVEIPQLTIEARVGFVVDPVGL